MRNKITTVIFSILVFSAVAAQEAQVTAEYSGNTFRQIELMTPWLQSGNATGLRQIPSLFPGSLQLGVDYQNGDFKTVHQGDTRETFSFGSKNYKKIKHTVLYGEFAYWKNFEHDTGFSNVNQPEKVYPYLLADTIGNDTFDREFFALKGSISSPVNEKLDWGIHFRYKTGTATQNRDPRPENKITELSVLPGLLYRTNNIKLGANLKYAYYNEDIDISVVEENTVYTLFQLHGLGTSDYHTASSFYRLYRQHIFGGGAQIEYLAGAVENLMSGNIGYFFQRVDDGRKAGNASWAAIKNDSEMEGIDFSVSHASMIKKNSSVNRIDMKMNMATRRGSEFIQRLEETGETDLEHWITYSKDPRYYSSQLDMAVSYSYLGLHTNGQMESLFKAGVSSVAFKEKYYLPDLIQKHRNMQLNISYAKIFYTEKATTSVELKFVSQINLSGKQDINDSFIVEKIIQPNYDFVTSNYLAPGAVVSYEFPMKKQNANYFIKTDFDWFRNNEGLSRTCLNFSTGIIF